MRVVMILALAVVAAGCTWVKPTSEGEKVRVVSAAEVAKCEKRGQTTVSLIDRLAGIRRDPQQVQKELDTLARNSAVTLEGDSVVPVGKEKDGRQTYDVYRCAPR